MHKILVKMLLASSAISVGLVTGLLSSQSLKWKGKLRATYRGTLETGTGCDTCICYNYQKID